MSRERSTFVGFHAIGGVIRSGVTGGTLYVHGSGSRIDELIALAKMNGVRIEPVDRRQLERLGGTEARGVVLVATVAPQPRIGLAEAIGALTGDRALVLVLDHVTDPQNYGAILRSADQFEVDFVLVPERRAAGRTDAVFRASAGAAASVRVVEVANIAQGLSALKDAGFWVYGADMGGKPLDGERLDGRVVVVLGSEGTGLSRLITDRCDVIVSIPTGGTIDSLNVSVSAGICLYEVTRQQRLFRD